jgi:alanine dehydrogenase
MGALMEQLSLGVCGTSRKENERRLPVHPLHFDRIDAGLRAGIFLERGYGERFGMADAQLAPMVAGGASARSARARRTYDRIMTDT